MWRYFVRFGRCVRIIIRHMICTFFTDCRHTETNNIINEANGGYESVQEYIPIGQPNAGTLAKLATLQSSTVSGDRKYSI